MAKRCEFSIKSFMTLFLVLLFFFTLGSGALVFWSGVSGYLNTNQATVEAQGLADRLHEQVLTVLHNDPSSSPRLEALRREVEEIRTTLAGKEEVKDRSVDRLKGLAEKLQTTIDDLEDIRKNSTEYRSSLVVLLEEIRALRAKTDHVDKDGDPLVSSLIQGTRDFWDWAGPGNMLFFAFISLVLFVATRENLLRNLLGPGREWNLELAGFKFGSKTLETEKFELTKTQKEIDSYISEQYERQIAELRLDSLFDGFCQVIGDCLHEKGVNIDKTPHRRTYFVPAYLTEHLVQAAEYRGYKFSSGSKKFGRIFSVRYGIIGKAWRLRRPLYNPNVSNVNEALIYDWGLTHQEAQKQGNQKRALLALPIPGANANSDPLAVIYIEAFANGAFGTPSDPTNFAAELFEKAKDYPIYSDFRGKLTELEQRIRWGEKSIKGDGR